MDREALAVAKVLAVELATLPPNRMTSIGFDNPLALVLVPVIATILILLLYRSRKRSSELSSKLGGLGGWKVARALLIAKLVAPMLLAIAVAQPYTVAYTYTPVTMDNILSVNITNAKIVILLDISTSMGNADAYPTRIGSAVDLVLRIARKAVERRDAVEVYGFSNDVRFLCMATNTSSLETCSSVLSKLELEKYSAVGDAIYFGFSKAKTSPTPTALLVVTDGAANYGSPVEDAVKVVANGNIPLLAILVGSDPRASSFEEVCKRHGIQVVRVGVLSNEEEALNYIAEKLYAEARYEAFKASGKLYIETPVKDYSIQLYTLLVALPLIVLSLAEGL
ncbi:MAG: vWA domain-containing protein [Ignisphaera sp.]